MSAPRVSDYVFLIALAGCSATPQYRPPDPTPPPSVAAGAGDAGVVEWPVRNAGDALAKVALDLQGTPYRYGGATRDGFVAVRDSEVVQNNSAGFFFIGASGLIVNSSASEHEIGFLWSGVTFRDASTETPAPGAREVLLVDTKLYANKEAHAEATHVAPLPEPAY